MWFYFFYLSERSECSLYSDYLESFSVFLCARSQKTAVTPIDLLMVKFTFYKRSNNLIVHLFAFRKTNGFSY
ncbi:hypothetical protein PDPE_1-03043 [Photobacterium damselae subsp. piscicida]|nr:hypothetical protein PDPE_1-03043 [Photobacterium damselae subsp. piscicida]